VKVSWRPRALTDIEKIADYIAADDVAAADRMRDRIKRTAAMLSDHPALGRKGRMGETRELVVTGSPYLIAYRLTTRQVTILRVIHGARDWPRRM